MLGQGLPPSGPQIVGQYSVVVADPRASSAKDDGLPWTSWRTKSHLAQVERDGQLIASGSRRRHPRLPGISLSTRHKSTHRPPAAAPGIALEIVDADPGRGERRVDLRCASVVVLVVLSRGGSGGSAAGARCLYAAPAPGGAGAGGAAGTSQSSSSLAASQASSSSICSVSEGRLSPASSPLLLFLDLGLPCASDGHASRLSIRVACRVRLFQRQIAALACLEPLPESSRHSSSKKSC